MKKILLIFICITLTLTLFSNQKSKKIISNQFFYNVENLTNEFKESDSIFNGFHNAANYSSRRGTSKGDALIAGGVVTFTVSFVLCFLDNTIAASVDLITAAPETNDKVFNGVMILSSFFPIVGPVSLIAANSYWMYRWGYIYGDGLIKDAGRAVQIFFGTIFLIGEIIRVTETE